MTRTAASLVPVAAALAALASVSCGSLKPFRVVDRPEPSPASLLDTHSRGLPDLPFGFAREDDYVVRVVAGSVTCSGTLIDDDQVLTAHHCVSERDHNGDFVAQTVSPSKVQVELGGDYLPWGEVSVRAIVAPPCGHAAGIGDIAVLVLSRKLIGVATITPRLDASADVGEAVEPVGFGRCALSDDGVRRKERIGGKVTDLLESRFRLTAAICPGDSGGPARSARGDVVGVISRAVMDGSEHTTARAEFTRLDRWRSVFSTAKLIAAGASPSELPPLAGCPR
ncbi:MAG: S1 family peptidase [Polyangiaceae bacterium]|nr:S1 family peptidase [Polyangiaceae bacterium]